MLIRITKLRREKGFTLIELMIVIAILGILAAIAIPQFTFYRHRSYNSAAQHDLKNFCTAQEGFFVDNQTYTTSIGRLINSYGAFTSENVVVAANSGNTTLYNMTASHSSGDATYTISGPGGTIVH